VKERCIFKVFFMDVDKQNTHRDKLEIFESKFKTKFKVYKY
jgi:hypothetical protein